MSLRLLLKKVGPWPMNAYILICEDTGKCAIIDPGADAGELLAMNEGGEVDKLLVTHGHPDHVGVMAELQEKTEAPIYMHPLDAQRFGLKYDRALEDGGTILVGNHLIAAIHTPGHTKGMMCFDLGDGRIIVGDTIFVGGPGKTWTPDEFITTMQTMENIIFRWPDETTFYPGHGSNGRIGDERPAYEKFVACGWPVGLFGDITWT